MSSFLAQVKERGAELPPALSGALLLAAVRLSEQRAEGLRPDTLLVDDAGQLELQGASGAVSDAYRAPELRKGTSPPRDPRVLVYAAGALGYELMTLKPLGEKAGPELKGPLAEVIRKAVAHDRRKRYRNLDELAKAIEEVQARPTEEEERLILAAVASTTPAPAAAIARVQLEKKKAMFAETPAPGETPQDVHPLLDHAWDPLEAPPPVVVTPPPALADPGLVELHESQAREAHQPTIPGVNETPIVSVKTPPQVPWSGESADVKSLIEAEAKARREDMAVLESRMDNFARLGTRLSGLEEKLKSVPVAPPASVPPGVSNPPLSLARVVKDLIEERRFAEAERALDVPELQRDALLQLRLGQVLSAQSDMTGRAEAAFRRAAELDAGWALPKALLGAALLRRGKRHEGNALLRAALAIDPSCVEAQVALRAEPLRKPALWLAGGIGGGIAAGVLVALALIPKPAPVERIIEKQVPVAVASVAPQPAPVVAAPVQQPVPEPPSAREEPRPPPESHPARPPRQHKVASASGGNRAAASEAAAKGDKALRSFNTAEALTAFQSALKLDPSLPGAHRGMGMVYVLQGKTADAKVEYQKYLQLAPDAPDREQIQRLLSR